MRLQLKTPAISSFLTFKGPRGGAFELPIATRKFGGGYSSSKLGDVAVYNVELILSTAPASISAPTTRVFEPPTRPVSISPQQRKVQNCIKFLENKYTIIPPQ
jgi:hypothetical protein